MYDFVIVIGTYDPYWRAWEPMCHGLEKYWPEHPKPVEWITSKKQAPCGITHAVGHENDWSARMKAGLKKVAAHTLLWLTEDNWLTAPVHNEIINRYASYINKRELRHIRLYPGWEHDEPDGGGMFDESLARFSLRSPYRASLKPGLWNRWTFYHLLREGETPWEFEQFGSKRSREYANQFCAIKDWNCFYYVTKTNPDGLWVKSPVFKGHWTVAAKKYKEKEKLDIDLSKHPVPGYRDPKLKKADWILP